mgnify:CR=1 FL=1
MIAYKVGEVVKSRGGTEQDDKGLLREKQPFALGGHKTRGVRLIKGSKAADWSPAEFTQAVEKIYGKVRGISRSSNLWHLHMIALDKVLAPKASASSSMDTDVDQHLAAGPFGGLVLQTASPRLGTGG